MPRKSKYTTKKIRPVKPNDGQTNLALESFSFPRYDEVMTNIVKKVGKRPPLPKILPKGTWTKQALRVLKERYLLKDNKGKMIETPEQMCWRVAWEIASAEGCWGKTRKEVKDLAEKYYKLLATHEFLPNSPTLMNAGADNRMQYSGCFVLPVEDSLEEIFDAIKYQALIHQTGGGTGFSFSRLRPQGSIVSSSGGVASGPVSFMRIFDAATNEIKQGGKRRGANMGILRVDHPDILEFIHCKEDGGITNFNISVAITDKFMDAYKKGTNYDLVDPKTKKKTGELSAREVFEKIQDSAWKTGDPGVIFIDRRNKGTSNPVPALGPIEATNPCGEQELYPFDACNLGSIFLGYFIKEKDPSVGASTEFGRASSGQAGEREVDWEKLRDVVRLAVRFLDSVIEVNPYPLDKIRQTVLATRRIGLGIGGWADMLIELNIPYDSDDALSLAKEVMGFIQKEAVKATQKLAKERAPFPLWPISIYKNETPRRNSTVTTIAPTGTISIIAGASSGIEPLFAIAFQHVVKDKHLDRTLNFINPKFEKIARESNCWSREVEEKVAESGMVSGIDQIPQKIKDIFRTAHEIHHDWHIKTQAAFQKYTDNAVSKTINMKNHVTPEDIGHAYLLAWTTDCKGVTVFRDGCKETQVLNMGVRGKEESSDVDDGPTLGRPLKVIGATYKMNTPVGSAFVTINEDETGEPLEVFINVGKAGSDVTAMAEALGRTISTSLRFKGRLQPKERAREIALQLAGIGGRRSVGFGKNKILSLPDAIAAALSMHFGFKVNGFLSFNSTGGDKYRKDESVGAKKDLAEAVMTATLPSGNGEPRFAGSNDRTAVSAESFLASRLTGKDDPIHPLHPASEVTPKAVGDICPSCGASSLVYQEGCVKCSSCGHSEC